MANAFDEIIIEEDPHRNVDVIIVEEGQLERSEKSNESL
jgi:hypothetical protein